MSNMSYCRFFNTAADLQDCAENLFSLDPRDASYNAIEERRARKRLILTCADILDAIGVELEYHDIEDRISELDDHYEPNEG